MNPFLSHLQSELRRTRLTRRGATDAPEDVPKGLHKKYERMEKIILPPLVSPNTTLVDTLNTRESYFDGSMTTALTISELGNLLGTALGKRDSMHRKYPSGGGLYPIETYLVSNVGGKKFAVYHYNPTEHSLEKLWNVPDDLDIKSLARKPDDIFFSTMIIFTSVWSRSSAKYGDLSFQHALLEAGHMSQNILLTATALDLGSRPYAGFDDERLIELLDIDSITEQPVHTVLLSR